MKKVISILIIITIFASMLAGCGSSSSSSSKKKSKKSDDDENTSDTVKSSSGKGVELGKEYKTSNDLEFTLFKISTSKKLQSLGGNGGTYDAGEGYNYVDVVITVTNNGNEEFSIDEGIYAYFKTDIKTQIEDTMIALETSDNRLSTYDYVKPLSTSKIHIGYKVPNNITEGRAYFEIGGDIFTVEYDASKDVSNKKAVSLNEEIKVEDVASFKLLSTKFTTDVLPPNTSGYYRHYPIDDPSSDTYFVVYCDLTNFASAAIGSDDMISIRAIFDGKYEYTANMALEEKDGTGFDYANITNVNPLETRKAVFMFEVPLTVQDMDCELSIYFCGNEYSFTV